MNPSRPRLDPADPYYPGKLRQFDRDAGQRADIESPSGTFGVGAGLFINPTPNPTVLLTIVTGDNCGHYTAVPARHQVSTVPLSSFPPRQVDTFPADTTGTLGPACTHDIYPLVETSRRPDAPAGVTVVAWPSQSSDSWEFRYDRATWVRVTGASVDKWYPVTAEYHSVPTPPPTPPVTPGEGTWTAGKTGYALPNQADPVNCPMVNGERYLAYPTDPRQDGSIQWVAQVPRTRCQTFVTSVSCDGSALAVTRAAYRILDYPECT